jgi:hypothetical protein
MINIWSDIWVGDWLDKVKEQNRILSGQKATSLTPEEKAVWNNFEIQGRKQFDKYHPGENWNRVQGAAYFANTYILQQRAAKKSASTKASAQAASRAASAQASAQASKEATARAATVAKQSGEKAAQSAAIAERARADYERQKSAVATEVLKQSSASAGKGAAIAARSAQEYEDRKAMEAALKEKEVRYLDADVQAKHDQEQAEIDKAKLEARITQEQIAREAAEERAANAEANQIIYTYSDTGTTPYYSSGDNMDNNLTLEPVAVQGTNLRNSLLLVGGVALVWWLLKKKKRGR